MVTNPNKIGDRDSRWGGGGGEPTKKHGVEFRQNAPKKSEIF